jgi:hypothetical protein
MQRRDDRLAFAADNIRRVVLVLIVRFHYVEIIGCVLLQVGHQTRGKRSFRSRATVALSGMWKVPLAGEPPAGQLKGNHAGGDGRRGLISADTPAGLDRGQSGDSIRAAITF